ncbi:aminopeptidase N-like [Penaeus monodon]|uniref:aminopeptidase N-like n=1 Tax=Penaeus monodon TaxID=6687 RepID=UPI0018A7BE56|nr:aminopeptidase N-like [Penaeus monodon]
MLEEDIRLPQSLRPLHYLIQLQPFINGNFSIVGYMKMEVEVLDTTSNIILHMLDIITKNDTVVKSAMLKRKEQPIFVYCPLFFVLFLLLKVLTSGDVEQRQVGIKSQHYDPVRQFYVAQMEEELMKGERYTLQMEFLGYLSDQLRGFYRSSYKDNNGEIKYLAVSMFQPTDARRAFPCFDEPALKATFEVHLARETWMTSLSNMPLAETRPVEGQNGWVWDCFHNSVPMSTSIVAFAILDFSHVSSTTDKGTLFRVWAQPSAIQKAEYAKEVGPQILAFYENYFNVPYSLPKMDMIAVPDFSVVAMENWGLITFKDRLLLYDPSTNTKGNLLEPVAHEVSHQWFGNLVTPKWWDDLWLNEGFATFAAYLGTFHVEPSVKKREPFTTNTLHPILITDSFDSSHQVRMAHGDAIVELSDDIIYQKGASLVRMMLHFLSEPTFRSGIESYLKTFSYSSAEQDDLWEHLTAAAHRDRKLPENLTVKTIMDTWTLQKGFPVVKVARSSDGTSADVSQEHFLLMKNENLSQTQDLRWWVPLSYTSQSEANFDQTEAKRLMEDSEERITITSLPPKDQWVIFNLQQTGYYRVNYDDHNWNLLVQQLKDDHEVIHVVNRAQIIDDAMNLARAGQLSYTMALEVYAYLKNEKEDTPYAAARNSYDYLRLMFSGTEAEAALEQYYSASTLQDITWASQIPPSFLEEALRLMHQWMNSPENKKPSLPFSGVSPYFPYCSSFVVFFFSKYFNALVLCYLLYYNPVSPSCSSLYGKTPFSHSIFPPDLREVFICEAVGESGEEEWNFVWSEYMKSNDALDKATLLNALTCTKNSNILSRFLDMAISPDSGIKMDDIGSILQSVNANSEGQSIAWNFLKKHWNHIFPYKKQKRGELLWTMTVSFKTQDALRDLEAFLQDSNTDLKEVTVRARQVVERTKINVKWMETSFPEIVQFLENRGYSTKGNGA